VPRTAHSLKLNESDKQQLLQWSTAFGTPQQVALRCRIVLTAAEGRSADEIAAKLDVDRKTAMLWRARFELQGLDGLWEVAPGRGRKPQIDALKWTATYSGKQANSMGTYPHRGIEFRLAFLGFLIWLASPASLRLHAQEISTSSPGKTSIYSYYYPNAPAPKYCQPCSPCQISDRRVLVVSIVRQTDVLL
jgi:hypothetical protein